MPLLTPSAVALQINQVIFEPSGALGGTSANTTLVQTIFTNLKTNPSFTGIKVRKALYDFLTAHGIASSRLSVVAEPAAPAPPAPTAAQIPALVNQIAYGANGVLATATANTNLLNQILSGIKSAHPSSVSARKAATDWLAAHGASSFTSLVVVPEPLTVADLPRLLGQMTYDTNNALRLNAANSDLENQVLKILQSNATASVSAPSDVTTWLAAHGIAKSRLIATSMPTAAHLSPDAPELTPQAPPPPPPVALAAPMGAYVTPVAPMVAAPVPAPAPAASLADNPDLTQYDPSQYSPPQAISYTAPTPPPPMVMQAAPPPPPPPAAPAPATVRMATIPPPAPAPAGAAYDRFTERANWTAYYNNLTF